MMKLVDYFYIVAFCGILAIVAIFSLTGVKTLDDKAFATAEMRQRNTLPPYGWHAGQLKNFFSSAEGYYCDRMPYRINMLNVSASIGLRLGRTMNGEQVIIGRDGWLFFGNAGQQAIDQFRGLRPLNVAELNNWESYFTQINEHLDSLGIPFVVAIAPDKHCIYPEYLPYGITKKGVSPWDQFYSKHHPFALIDLKTHLARKKGETEMPLYHKTDTHWNEMGAFTGYRLIMDQIGNAAGVEPLVINDSSFRVLEITGNGDLTAMQKGNLKFTESLVHLNRSFFKGQLQVQMGLDSREILQMDPNSAIRISDNLHIRVLNANRKGKLMVLGDSFNETISIYLNNTFGEVIYHHYSADSADISGLVSKFDPDAVLFLMVERNFVTPITAMAPLRSKIRISSCDTIRCDSLLTRGPFISQITGIKVVNGEVHFTSTGDDPYFFLPLVAVQPKPAIVKLDITIPQPLMVQLYYQTTPKNTFCEEQSIKKVMGSGRHRINFPIEDPKLNGIFRLDPGNAPGKYIIHGFSVCQ